MLVEWSGSDLKAWRSRLGLSQQEAADAIGISLRTYNDRERSATVSRECALACGMIEQTRRPSWEADVSAFMKQAQEIWDGITYNVAPDAPPRFPHGYYEAGLKIDSIRLQDPATFRDTLGRALQNHSGWPPFVIINRAPFTPRLVEGAIQAWHGPDLDGTYDEAPHCDFWRIAPNGRFYTRRGYNEDKGYKEVPKGATFDITTATWRVGEIIMQAHYLAQALDGQGSLHGRFHWTGLKGRKLISLGNPGRMLSGQVRESAQDQYTAAFSCDIARLPADLPQVVHGILKGLYLLFDFWKLSDRLVQEELTRLLHDRF